MATRLTGQGKAKTLGKIISFSNQKGGVGKTTSTINIAAAMVADGHRVLAIDLDPQGSLTLASGENPVDLAKNGKTITSVLVDEKPIRDVIMETNALPALVPSSLDLAKAEVKLNSEMVPAAVLKRRIAPVKEEYDFILIDCPPTMGVAALNGLGAADGVLIPVKTDYLSIHGVEDLLGTIYSIREQVNPVLEVIGCIPTMHMSNNKVDRASLEFLKNMLADITTVFEPVPHSTEFQRSHMEGRAAVGRGGSRSRAQAYINIAKKVVEHYGK